MIKLRRKGPRRFDLYIDRVEVDRAELGIEQRSVQISIAADDMRARFDGRGEMDLFGPH